MRQEHAGSRPIERRCSYVSSYFRPIPHPVGPKAPGSDGGARHASVAALVLGCPWGVAVEMLSAFFTFYRNGRLARRSEASLAGVGETSFIHDLSGVLAFKVPLARDQDASSSWSVGCFPEGRDVCLGASRYLSFVRQGHAQLEALPSDLPTQPCLCLIVGLSQLSFRLAPFSRILRQNLSTS